MAVSERKPVVTGSPEFYRGKAQEALRQAEVATTDQIRTELLTIAEHWQRLAQRAELPNW